MNRTPALNKFKEIIVLCNQGQLTDAIQTLTHSAAKENIFPDSLTYQALLQCCLNHEAITESKLVHSHIIQTGHSSYDIHIGTRLVNIYSKYGVLEEGKRVLHAMPKQNVVTWTALLAAYVKKNEAEEAFRLFKEMIQCGISPNEFTFSSVLSACAEFGDVYLCKGIHAQAINLGFISDVFVCNGLVRFYGKLGKMDYAAKVFDKIGNKETSSWNTMLSGLLQNGLMEEAMELFRLMPNKNVRTWTAMVSGCAENGFIDEALDFFDRMPERNEISWSAIVSGLVRNSLYAKAVDMYWRMTNEGLRIASEVVASVSIAYANLGNVEQCREFHEEVRQRGFESEIYVSSALVDMYAKCGLVDEARDIFNKMVTRDVVSWTSLISGYARVGNLKEAMKLFQEMPTKSAASCNAMISGYAQNDCPSEALRLFRNMVVSDVQPNMDSCATILPICASSGSLKMGKEIHENIIRHYDQMDVYVGTAIVDMYARCGRIRDARRVFDRMRFHDKVTWTALIGGYAMHGYGEEALLLFDKMQSVGIKPDHVTFLNILCACCHTGQVEKGKMYFESMTKDYHMNPSIEHYCCMVDIFGRSGKLHEALEFVNAMPMKPDASIWGSLLGACRNHSNLKLGEYVAECLVQSDPTNAAHYVILSNVYAAIGKWKEVDSVRRMMKERNVNKTPGSSWIEVKNHVHVFVVGDRSHPQTEKIYTELENLDGLMKETGYVPNTNFVLHDVEEEQKNHAINHHSEKLAISFGLISTPPRTCIHIIKNLRVCGDCHTAIKFISKVVSREIIVRDTNRFHHFSDGKCSCGDYW